jgi:hypothetical protein
VLYLILNSKEMIEILEILKYTIPGLIVLLTAYLLLKTFFENYNTHESKDLKLKIDEIRLQLKHEDRRVITPIRLQAYERVILFCERISPQSLIFRVKKPGQTNVQLQTELLRTIRDEAEHNLSQQLYINKDTWKIVKQSKEETIKIVNQASTKVDPKGDSSELSKAIFEIMAELGNPPTDKAIEQMKTDVQKYF